MSESREIPMPPQERSPQPPPLPLDPLGDYLRDFDRAAKKAQESPEGQWATAMREQMKEIAETFRQKEELRGLTNEIAATEGTISMLKNELRRLTNEQTKKKERIAALTKILEDRSDEGEEN